MSLEASGVVKKAGLVKKREGFVKTLKGVEVGDGSGLEAVYAETGGFSVLFLFECKSVYLPECNPNV